MIQNNRYYWSHLKTRSVTVSVKPSKRKKGIVFRVSGMIDVGNGRQTVMLEHVDYPKSYGLKDNCRDVAVPFRMGHLDFIYASGKRPSLRNIKSLLSTVYKNSCVEKIVPEVLAPGDLLVFEQDEESGSLRMVNTLRVVQENSYKKSRVKNAL